MNDKLASLYEYLVRIRNNELYEYRSYHENFPTFMDNAKTKRKESIGWYALYHKFTEVKNFEFITPHKTLLSHKDVNCQYNIYLTVKGCWFVHMYEQHF